MPGGVRPPPSVVASWPTPNYADPATKGPALVYVCIIFSALGLVVVSARTYARLFITRAPGIDDVLVVVSLAFAIALSVLVVIGNRDYATGHHIWDVLPSKYAPSRLNTWICEWCYMVASCSVKISILLFYRRLTGTFSCTFMVATYTGIAYNLIYLVAFSLPLLLQCRPMAAYWLSFDPAWLAEGHAWSCPGNESYSLPLSAAFAVVGDCYSTVLPLLLVTSLQMPARQKRALYALFSLGFLDVAVGIVRTILLNTVLNGTYDFSWVLWDMWIWTIIELYVAIGAASAPALKPFFTRVVVEPIRQKRKHSRPSLTISHATSGAARRPGRRSLGSATRMSMRSWAVLPPDLDVEHIGMARASGPTEKHTPQYEVRDAKEMHEPVVSTIKPQPSWDASSGSHESEQWILPHTPTTHVGAGDACELNSV